MAAVVRPAGHSLPCKALLLSGVSYGDGILPFRDEVKHLGIGGAVASGPDEPQAMPCKRTDLGYRMVADGRFGGLARGFESKKSLQISDGPQRARTPDLRRANASHVQLAAASK